MKEDGEDFGGMIAFDSNEACQTCLFAHSEPFDSAKAKAWNVPVGWQITPDKCNCQIYEPDDLGDKPRDIAEDGAECEYYEKA